jgi:hypothetical protein
LSKHSTLKHGIADYSTQACHSTQLSKAFHAKTFHAKEAQLNHTVLAKGKGKESPVSLACHTTELIELEEVTGLTKDCLFSSFSSFSSRFVAPLKGLELERECIEAGQPLDEFAGADAVLSLKL